ncbi:hypothetical protein HCH_00821 [Hahella chejuensis KCTC 2396]|uniref:Uncharacterized protein n=1 Tax=Hahella chejuensis (strain KCTC 2396) TaxID=349521 RepID=Q2SNQ9_HAHCH|nr:hypothetical protein [Hahella chejuensis]ABC27715.1 hypothetical protein HCH_00821 [Hahella chejuensis KCTC 2396]
MNLKPAALLCCLLSPSAFGGETAKDFLGDFVIGAYQLIGKAPDSTSTYQGALQIYSENHQLKIKREIDGAVIFGEAAIEEAAHGEATVLRMRFKENNVAYESTCLVQSDLDNYARISCHLYQANNESKSSGLEALFIDHHKL